MRFQYGQSNLAQGRDNQQLEYKQPNTYGSMNSADRVTQNSRLDSPKQNMAGHLPQFLLDYVTNPQERERRDGWNQRFAMSNQGAEFNIAKMNGGQLPMGDNA